MNQWRFLVHGLYGSYAYAKINVALSHMRHGGAAHLDARDKFAGKSYLLVSYTMGFWRLSEWAQSG